MCGIVCFFGGTDGLAHVLEALYLLEYRAPDSSGIGLIAEDGRLSVRRSVGAARKLADRLIEQPAYRVDRGARPDRHFFTRQGYPAEISEACDGRLEELYLPGGLRIGMGDRGGIPGEDLPPIWLSGRMRTALDPAGSRSFSDYSRDVVRHAFRLVGAQVASRVDLDPLLRARLDEMLLERVRRGAYADWQSAWQDEWAKNVPGQAFSVAVRCFQEEFPGLAEHLEEDDWERVGGLTAQAMAQVVLGHGRWAMVGAVTEANAHPFLDRSETRLVCENGSHNPSLMLSARRAQENWWRARGVPDRESIHRSENTTEVLVYEWERAYHQLCSGEVPSGLDVRAGSSQREDEIAERRFLDCLSLHDVEDAEEAALRLAVWRLKAGNAHACAFYSRRHPGRLYISSHHKPIAVVSRLIREGGGPGRREVMVASDVNAALMLWPGSHVDAAAARLQDLRKRIASGTGGQTAVQREMQRLIESFRVEVIYLDDDLAGGEELFAVIENRIVDGRVEPDVRVTRYDGTPVAAAIRTMDLDPAMVGKRGYPTYTESHIAEIPEVFENLVRAYNGSGRVRLDSAWQDGRLLSPGLNVKSIQAKFGARLEKLKRVLLIGEGSSWRDAQAAAPVLRSLLPDVVVTVYRPVEALNLGKAVDPQGDLAVEVSWSGTTDSLLKIDSWLNERQVIRLGVTGRPQSDLGRRTGYSAGTLDVRSGVEVSVATVKGYHAILATLDLLALQLSSLRGADPLALARYRDELSLLLPPHIRNLVGDEARREQIRETAQRCRGFNKVVVAGDSPVEVEAELKIEELAQIVALHLDFHAPSLRALIESSAMQTEDRRRVLFVINATTADALLEVRPVLEYLQDFGLFGIVHTVPGEIVERLAAAENLAVFVSPQVSSLFQPLIDVLFFFELAVAMAYARGLEPEEIDRPRNLAKSVTTTGAERRSVVETRQELINTDLAAFSRVAAKGRAWDRATREPSRAALGATVALRTALSVVAEPVPEKLSLEGVEHLLVVADTEATENAGHMAAGAWQELQGMDLTVYRLFFSELPKPRPGILGLRLVRAGALLSVHDGHTIALPADFSPLQWELLGAFYLISLAVRLARQQGKDVSDWEPGLARIPLMVDGVLADRERSRRLRTALEPYLAAGYDKAQIIGGGQDFPSAESIARSLRSSGFLAEALYTDSAWHGPLATVGGEDAEHDTLIFILATDPLFQAAALVDTQVYRTRRAPVILVVPEGNQDLAAVRGVDPSAVIEVPAAPRAFVPLVNAAFGAVLAREIVRMQNPA